MHERIARVIDIMGLKKIEFAKRLGISAPFVSELCTGVKKPSDRTIADICREFNISENWLRTGEGEMFIELPQNEALAAQIQSFLKGGTDSFRERLITLLLRLTPEQWDVLEGYLLELIAAPTTEAPAAPPQEMSDAEYHAELDRQLTGEKRPAESGLASGHGSSGTVVG